MAKEELPGGTVHTAIPSEFREALFAHPEALATWHDITPLARNEWICLVRSAKSDETLERRIKRAYSQLEEGQRRPYCWPGCPHREKNGK